MKEGVAAVELLLDLLVHGLDGWRKLSEPGFRVEDLSPLKRLLSAFSDAHEDLTESLANADDDLLVRHAALVTAAFGEAWADHWAGSRDLAPREGRLRFRDWLGRGFARDRKRDLAARLRTADITAVETALHGDVGDLEALEQLVVSPVATEAYTRLWSAFTDLDEPGDDSSHEPFLVLEGPDARARFEQDFLVAWARGRAEAPGAELRRFVHELAPRRAGLLRHLLVSDTATWGSRHVFGNVEVGDLTGLPPMTLAAMYVEPSATLRMPLADSPAGRSLRDAWPKARWRAAERHGVGALRPQLPLGGALSLLDPATPGSITARFPLTIVTAHFGEGKSLTARELTRQLAARFLAARVPGPDAWVPIYIRLADHLRPDRFDLTSLTRSAAKLHARRIGYDRSTDDPAFDLPASSQRVLWLLDGLDEVSMSIVQHRELLHHLRDRSSDRHRFVVFTRPAGLAGGVPGHDLPVLGLEPFDHARITDWLGRWQRVCHGDGPFPTIEDLRAGDWLESACTPIILFMIAHGWRDLARPGTSDARGNAALYERFIDAMARGKYERDRDKHEQVAEAAEHITEALRSRGARVAGPPEAMQRVMQLLAWEAYKARSATGQMRMGPAAVERVLRDHIGVDGVTPDIMRTLRVGALLVMQARPDGTPGELLFGHKSFVEYLVAAHWAQALDEIVTAPAEQWPARSLELLGGGDLLMGENERTFDFLAELIARWPAETRERLSRWARETFDRDTIVPDSGAARAATDRQAPIRRVALALASLDGPVEVGEERLRSLAAHYVAVGRRARIYAPGVRAAGLRLEGVDMESSRLPRSSFEGASLRGVNLCRSDLRHADFSDTSLQGARLNGADLTGARFEAANCAGAQFGGATLRDASLVDANLVGTYLADSDLRGAVLTNANLHGANLMRADLRGASLEGANLQACRLDRARFDDAVIDASTLGLRPGITEPDD